MGLDNVSGGKGVQQTSSLESLRLGTKKDTPVSTDSTEKQTQIPSDKVVNNNIERGNVPVDSILNELLGGKVQEKETPKPAVRTNPEAQVPQTTQTPDSPNNNVAMVGRNMFTNVKPVVKGMDLKEAQELTKENDIDEVYFKTQDGKLYVAFGTREEAGALKLDKLKEGQIGIYNNQKIKVVHIDNEANTALEGAKAPFISTWNTIKDAGAAGLTKGIAEIGTTLVAIFVGKSILQNGITAASAAAAAGGTVKTAEAVVAGSKIVGGATSTGRAILATVGSGLTQVATGAAVAAAVVGTVAGAMSIYGAISGARSKGDFTTIEMVTNPNLAFVSEK